MSKEYARVTFKGDSLSYSAVVPVQSCAKIIEYINKTEHYSRKPKPKKVKPPFKFKESPNMRIVKGKLEEVK